MVIFRGLWLWMDFTWILNGRLDAYLRNEENGDGKTLTLYIELHSKYLPMRARGCGPITIWIDLLSVTLYRGLGRSLHPSSAACMLLRILQLFYIIEPDPQTPVPWDIFGVSDWNHNPSHVVKTAVITIQIAHVLFHDIYLLEFFHITHYTSPTQLLATRSTINPKIQQ